MKEDTNIQSSSGTSDKMFYLRKSTNSTMSKYSIINAFQVHILYVQHNKLKVSKVKVLILRAKKGSCD